MKRITILLPLLLSLIAPTSCNYNRTQLTTKYDYCDFIDQTILYSNLLEQPQNSYIVYFYQKNCGHCNEIKQSILSYLATYKETSYLIEFSYEITICNSYEEIEQTISKNDFCILGTPSIALIEQKKVKKIYTGTTEILNLIS